MENLSENGHASTINRPLRPIQLRPSTLSEIGRTLQDEMKFMFRELTVDIAACPCLTREPFNLAGIGLCGNPSLIEVGGYTAFMPFPHNNNARWNIKNIVSSFAYDSFIIGTGYAAKPYMPYNGHLIMNAIYRAPNIMNASRIVFAETSNGQRRIETLTIPDQMMCSFVGNFFLSEGREGNVLRIRAKGRESNTDIITMIHNILYREFYVNKNRIVALGGVLRMRNGQVAQNVMPEEYPRLVSSFGDLVRWFQCHDIKLESDLIAVGTLLNNTPTELLVTEQRYGFYLPTRRHQFYSFSNYGAGGQFISDITKDDTEYEGYFNLATKIYSVNYCA
ncbi:ester hydrolase C11orf54 homolog [Temnothorax curvispinosus]|uniref:Ester hydrolase C11orf54 homolog n=1 Tax=Temnothorax curvispinosus TaxID=300111 RepID=A0A6J1PLP0_9HYME|nr:ester hydrolase C11orf54 homolog [Temnothorax curvispinosus]